MKNSEHKNDFSEHQGVIILRGKPLPAGRTGEGEYPLGLLIVAAMQSLSIHPSQNALILTFSPAGEGKLVTI
jgi:hypothetical protein